MKSKIIKRESRKNWMLPIFRKAGRVNSNNTYYQFWQQHNHPIKLFNAKIMEQKLNYVHDNPVKAGWVKHSWEFLYSSARDYYGIKGPVDMRLIDSSF